MFMETEFNQDISNWNVNNVKYFQFMFAYSKFNNNINNWNVSNAIDMVSMFANSKFNQDISTWFNKLNKKCILLSFGKLNNVKINSYENFKKYHRQTILNKL